MKKRNLLCFCAVAIIGLGVACANDDDDSEPSGPPTCSGLTGQPGSFELEIASEAGMRPYLLTVPDQYDPTVGSPLTLNFHGWTSSADKQDEMTEMSAKAQEEGFILLTPQGYSDPPSWNGGACCPPANLEVDDVAYVRQLVDALEADYCVDRARIYATGMSNGGFMSNRLACDASDLIAAIAPVSSVLGVEDCDPQHPVPIMMFNGTADTLVNYEGVDSLLDNFPSVPDSFEAWAEINGCSGSPETVWANGEVTCEGYTDCRAETVLCTIDGGGHTWPGSLFESTFGHVTQDINATDAMWEFFADKTRR